MIEILQMVELTLAEAGYSVAQLPQQPIPAALFEGATALGFVVVFPSVRALIDDWDGVIRRLVDQQQLGLRRSGDKAWNAYAVLLTDDAAGESIRPVLNAIEEDLVGLRKIVREGVATQQAVTRALLPLLPLLNSPELPVIDMEEEIRLRTGGVPSEALKAFFSRAPAGVSLQVIEES